MRSMGAPDVGVDGEVLESDPPHKLVQTWRMVMDQDMEDQGAGGGWGWVLSDLKTLLETGPSLDVER